jgi:hypothetical protein
MIETERRKPGVDVCGVPIKFGDGQLWHVPKPRVRFAPLVTDGQVELGVSTTYGTHIDALLLTMAIADDDVQRLAAVMTLAGLLLREYYDLASDELEQLLSLEAPDWMRLVVATATGHFGVGRR